MYSNLLCPMYHSESHFGLPLSFCPLSIKWYDSKHLILAQLTWKLYNILPIAIVSVLKPWAQEWCLLQDGSKWPPPLSPQSQLCMSLFQDFVCTLFQGWSAWPKEYGRNDGMWLSRLGHQRHGSFSLALRLLPPGKASCHTVRMLKQLSGEVHVVRNGGLLSTSSKNLRPPTNNCVSEPCCKQTLQPQEDI